MHILSVVKLKYECDILCSCACVCEGVRCCKDALRLKHASLQDREQSERTSCVLVDIGIKGKSTD